MSSHSFRQSHLLLATFVSACLAHTALAGEVKLAPANSAVLSPDTKTVIVAVPNEAALLYFNAETEKETRKLELEFKPHALAVQGKSLFVSTKGAATIHVLDLASGKEKQEIKIPGEPILNLACHPVKGLLYATNSAYLVYAIDPNKGTATKTKARGQMIAVDPKSGKFVYTGVQKPIRELLYIEGRPGRLSLDLADARAIMLKFAVSGTGLKPVAYQDNAALNGKVLAVSADGKRIAMAGGGGWVSRTNTKFNYGVAVFETSDLKTMVGEVECGAYPSSVSFHPVLNLGVVVKRGNSLIVFNGKSLATKATIKAPGGEPGLVLYAVRGTKLVQLVNSGTESILSFHSLKLSEQEMETLKAAYPSK